MGDVTTPTADAVAAAFDHRRVAVDDVTVGGRAYCHQLANVTDRWLAALAAQSREQHPRAPKFALVAVGGYGRGELSPQSDIDLLLVHNSNSSRIEAVASAIWYPIWDSGLQLGHAVRSIDEHLLLAKTDLDTATALLTARPIAGDRRLGETIVESGRSNWTKRKKRWLGELQCVSASASEARVTWRIFSNPT